MLAPNPDEALCANWLTYGQHWAILKLQLEPDQSVWVWWSNQIIKKLYVAIIIPSLSNLKRIQPARRQAACAKWCFASRRCMTKRLLAQLTRSRNNCWFIKWSIPRPHLSSADLCVVCKNLAPTSPTFPNLLESYARRIFKALFRLRATALVISPVGCGSKYSSKETRLQGGCSRKLVYWMNLLSSNLFAVAKPSWMSSIRLWRSCCCNCSMYFMHGKSDSIASPLSFSRNGAWPAHENSIRRLPAHLHWRQPDSFFSLSLSWDIGVSVSVKTNWEN